MAVRRASNHGAQFALGHAWRRISWSAAVVSSLAAAKSARLILEILAEGQTDPKALRPWHTATSVVAC